jgi:hypothetical protein
VQEGLDPSSQRLSGGYRDYYKCLGDDYQMQQRGNKRRDVAGPTREYLRSIKVRRGVEQLGPLVKGSICRAMSCSDQVRPIGSVWGIWDARRAQSRHEHRLLSIH